MKNLLSLLLLILCLVMSSFTQSPYLSIISSNPLEYGSYQIKITYTTHEIKAVPSLLITGSSRVANQLEFIPFYTSSVSYENDEVGASAVSCSASSIKKLIDAIALRPELCKTGNRKEPFISIMIERGLPPNEIVFEHLANIVEAHTILNLLEGAILTEPTATKLNIRRFRNYSIGHH